MRVAFSMDPTAVQRALNARAQRMADALAEVVANGAEIVADNWRGLAPVGPEPTRPEGRPHYRDAIHVEPEELSRTRASYLVGAGIYGIPWWLEYGTVKMAPHPSARPAVDASRGAVVDTLRSGLDGH